MTPQAPPPHGRVPGRRQSHRLAGSAIVVGRYAAGSFMRIFVLFALLTLSTEAAAYIGPGAGISFLGSLWTVLIGIVLALVAILAWPLRLLWRRMRGKGRRQPAAPGPADDA